MTEQEIIEAAKEANLSIRGYYDETGSTPAELLRFAKIIEAKALEKSESAVHNCWHSESFSLHDIKDAIRTLKDES